MTKTQIAVAILVVGLVAAALYYFFRNKIDEEEVKQSTSTTSIPLPNTTSPKGWGMGGGVKDATTPKPSGGNGNIAADPQRTRTLETAEDLFNNWH